MVPRFPKTFGENRTDRFRACESIPTRSCGAEEQAYATSSWSGLSELTQDWPRPTAVPNRISSSPPRLPTAPKRHGNPAPSVLQRVVPGLMRASPTGPRVDNARSKSPNLVRRIAQRGTGPLTAGEVNGKEGFFEGSPHYGFVLEDQNFTVTFMVVANDNAVR